MNFGGSSAQFVERIEVFTLDAKPFNKVDVGFYPMLQVFSAFQGRSVAAGVAISVRPLRLLGPDVQPKPLCDTSQ